MGSAGWGNVVQGGERWCCEVSSYAAWYQTVPGGVG